jgi:hypothetical protein
MQKRYLGTRLANLINVKVDVRKTTLEHNTLGVCHMAITGSKRQRKFRIVLNNRKDLHAQLETLAHEMVHVRQKAKNQLQYRWDRTGLNFKVRWMDNPPVRQEIFHIAKDLGKLRQDNCKEVTTISLLIICKKLKTK